MAGKITLKKDTQSVDLEIKSASVGPSVIDLKSLYNDTGYFTFDPSYSTTASCESKITYIDGAKGILEYRGYPIEQLAEQSTYLEVAYLLFNGELPTSNIALDEFRSQVKKNMTLPNHMSGLLTGFGKDAHPMAMLTTSVAALSGSYHNGINIRNKKHQKEFFFNILGKMPILVASVFNHKKNDANVEYDESLSYSENILKLFFGWKDGYEINPIFSKALDILLILHADHEQNCSTSSVRLTGSSGTNPYAAISAGVAALWGPAHGGANEAVVRMFGEIGSKNNISKYIDKAKDKNDPFRLMGFGHRVYKNYDPRATIIRSQCHKVLKSTGNNTNPMFELALQLEEIALSDDYFVDRNLYPNVDFYSGLIYEAMDIPKEMFTAMFALARTVGWATHWCEMMSNPKHKIGRPRQLYLGEKKRDYVPISDR
jgi:citrate synthase